MRVQGAGPRKYSSLQEISWTMELAAAPGVGVGATHSRSQGDMNERADFRRRAEQCVARAQEAHSSEQKALLIEMAHAWLRLADHAESIEALAKNGEQA